VHQKSELKFKCFWPFQTCAARAIWYDPGMALPLKKHYITPEEYYLLERASDVRHDYFDGEIFDMSGGSIVHSRICSNVIIALGSRLKGGPCDVFEANLRLLIRSTGLRCYPDASVYCGPLETDPQDGDEETVTNPTVVFEVLSPSTESYDRGAKSSNYKTIPSLKALVLVSRSSPKVEAFFRQKDESWLPVEISGLSQSLPIPAVRVELPLVEIYDRVSFLVEP